MNYLPLKSLAMLLRNDPSRRKFIYNCSCLFSALPLAYSSVLNKNKQAVSKDKLKIHVFSKHLQFLGYEDMANAAADTGFDGVELTVRKKGHVLPENITSDLPKSVDSRITWVGFFL